MRYLVVIILIATSISIGQAQNCNAFLYAGDTLQYEACNIAEKAGRHYQFSRSYQKIYDQAIDKCPYFATAYRSKSVAYLKSGDFITWKKLMDEAVRLDPLEHLGNRGWCRYQFFRDYKGAIADIELLDSLISYDIGYSVNGDYHLNIAKAICYKSLGEKEKAIQIIEKHLDESEFSAGLYDYLHLGVLYLELGDYDKAIQNLKLQQSSNELAENHYYIALAYKASNKLDESNNHLVLAKEFYQEGRSMFDGYGHHTDKVYLKQIEEELNEQSK